MKLVLPMLPFICDVNVFRDGPVHQVLPACRLAPGKMRDDLIAKYDRSYNGYRQFVVIALLIIASLVVIALLIIAYMRHITASLRESLLKFWIKTITLLPDLGIIFLCCNGITYKWDKPLDMSMEMIFIYYLLFRLFVLPY